MEEQSFKFTNAFTTADEGSVIKLRDTYRSLQTNGRPAANRDHKKAYKGITYPIVDHTMVRTYVLHTYVMYVRMYVHTY